MITEKLLSGRYKFVEGRVPFRLTQSQRTARELFLDEVHRKDRYVKLNACPYCGHGTFKKISETERRGLPSDIVICELCDGCFKLSILNPEANKFHYEKVSYLLRGKCLDSKSMEELFRKRVREFAYPKYRFIRHFLDLVPRRDLIVEFGCNDGANLLPWKENGFDVLGVDLDPEVVAFGRKMGLDLICADFLSCNFSGTNPRLVILSHMLEHVADVNTTLKRLYEIARPDRYIFIESPGIRIHGLRNTLAYFDIEHNYNFDLNSLNHLLTRHSFRPVYIDEYIRAICTPLENKAATSTKKVPFSLSKAASALFENSAKLIPLNRARLSDMLREDSDIHFIKLILHKLQMLYFSCHYSSLIKVK